MNALSKEQLQAELRETIVKAGPILDKQRELQMQLATIAKEEFDREAPAHRTAARRAAKERARLKAEAEALAAAEAEQKRQREREERKFAEENAQAAAALRQKVSELRLVCSERNRKWDERIRYEVEQATIDLRARLQMEREADLAPMKSEIAEATAVAKTATDEVRKYCASRYHPVGGGTSCSTCCPVRFGSCEMCGDKFDYWKVGPYCSCHF